MSNCRTYSVVAQAPNIGDGGATLTGFVATGSDSDVMLATVSGFKPNGGSHPTGMFLKRTVENGISGIWFRLNFVNDAANGTAWITFFQSGRPNWPANVSGTTITFDMPPWH
ncbi:hypothetical protein [Sulfuriferula sp.]|uniref:hypothetical protein n=1 Tax=Sulfuriferula sp. TaxID=2025307 RepID=UPI0027315D49|nr:hypothetical protein [Sulfuriferula sp.]MDP2026649.1 hypothetical protein [Sulfuriferula sp.]